MSGSPPVTHGSGPPLNLEQQAPSQRGAVADGARGGWLISLIDHLVPTHMIRSMAVSCPWIARAEISKHCWIISSHMSFFEI